MNTIYFYIYIIITLFIAIYLTLKNHPTHKYITFIIAYWILTGSVLSTKYFVIDIKRLPFDLQPLRIIFILFTIYLFLIRIGKIKNVRVNTQEPKFEKYLFLYIFLSIVVDVIHAIDILTTKDIIVNSTKILTFLVIYLVLKRTADKGMIKTLFKALIIVCILSSIVGIYQFLVDKSFFRFAAERTAFGGHIRSSGVYSSEDVQTYFLVPGIILVLFTIKNKILRNSLVTLLLIGIIIAFHRMSLFVTILILTLYFIEVKKKKVWRMITAGSIVVLLIFLFTSIFILNISNVKRSPIVQERLLADTTTGRIALYNMAINELPNQWLFGVGSSKSDVYYRGVLSAGGSNKVASGDKGGIHNLYLGMAYFYGLPVVIMFILFLAMAFSYFWRLSKNISVFFFIFIFEIIKYSIRNMSQSLGLTTPGGLLLAIFLGLGVAVYQKDIDVSRVINERISK